nr:alpha/beta fold hydrolase [Micromonospora sp. DSM 115978]
MEQPPRSYRLAPLSVPRAAERAAGRTVEIGDAAGVCQVFADDAATGLRRQVTGRPAGVDQCEIEPDGDHLWWFDADGYGEGQWLREPFAGGAAEPALSGVPAGRLYGVAIRPGPSAAIGVGVADRSRCYLGTPGGTGRLVRDTAGYEALIDLAPGAGLVVFAGAPGDRDAATIVATATGRTVAGLAGDARRRIWPMEFQAGDAADPELLLIVADGGRYTIATWRRTAGLRVHDWLPFRSEISAQWYGPDRTVLVQQDRAGRSRLLTVQLDRGTVVAVPTPRGTVTDVYAVPGGPLRCVWSRTGVAPRLLTLPAASVGTPAATSSGRSVRHRDLMTTGPHGQIHSFLSTPPGSGPWPTLFLVHGGPAGSDRDAYDPRVELLTDAGFAVVRTNYRGSTGYGARWQRTNPDRIGLDQIDDLAAVRRQLVRRAVAVPGRIGLLGHSWGGYLVLLALGAAPELWDVGLAGAPVADYPAAYDSATPALRAVDRDLFGGSPDQVPERYRSASPLTYVDWVRVPVLIAAAPDDPKCPWQQILRYTGHLRRRGVPHRLMPIGGGHCSRDAADHVAVLTAMRDFAHAVLGGARTSVSGTDAPRASRRTGPEVRTGPQVSDARTRRQATSPLLDPAGGQYPTWERR